MGAKSRDWVELLNWGGILVVVVQGLGSIFIIHFFDTFP